MDVILGMEKDGLILPRARFRNSFGVVRSGKRYLPKTEDQFQSGWKGNVDRKWLIPSPPDEHETLSEVAPASKKLFQIPDVNFGNHNKEYSIISSTEASFSFVALVFTFLITTSIFSSLIIQPLLFDASVVRTGRYALTMDAWDSIEEDDAVSVVGIGSSMLQYAMNGTCIEEEMASSNTFVYNLAIPGSMPYMEMIQTEAAVRASPDLVMLEVGPNSLWDVDEFSNQGLLDYFEMRLTIHPNLLMVRTMVVGGNLARFRIGTTRWGSGR